MLNNQVSPRNTVPKAKNKRLLDKVVFILLMLGWPGGAQPFEQNIISFAYKTLRATGGQSPLSFVVRAPRN